MKNSTHFIRLAAAASGLLLCVCAAVWLTMSAGCSGPVVGEEDLQNATYVGSDSCIKCHQQEHQAWIGSHHDLAMDIATEETVLASFDEVEIEHHGITSRAFRDGEKFMVETEGPDGKMEKFQVKYVFGVTPLQQYMVEFDRPKDAKENEVARLQVLRLSWDTENEKWFYLKAPDVDEKLEPDDELHWTGITQRWNTSCAECHSTDLQKNFDDKTQTYRTTFAEIDVSCEACHGPGSKHVELAEGWNPFWDAKENSGLAKLKTGKNTAVVEMCARCHSRQGPIHPDWQAGADYYDHFTLTPLLENVYYCDGQVLDEDYVHGSFIQSRMFHKNISCTDCHDPHTARLKHEGNKVCTSCHAHPAAKYDVPAHHRHKKGSTGAQCVECHMPATTYMALDARRDHSLRIPRPDISAELQTPNACTKCHLDRADLAAASKETTPGYGEWVKKAEGGDEHATEAIEALNKLTQQKLDKYKLYQDWMIAAREGDKAVAAALHKVDEWAAAKTKEWYGERKDTRLEVARALKLAWSDDPAAIDLLIETIQDRDLPALYRASALNALSRFADPRNRKIAEKALKDPHPMVRAGGISLMETARPMLTAASQQDRFIQQMRDWSRVLAGMLADETTLVRTEAARTLIQIPEESRQSWWTKSQQRDYQKAREELETRLSSISDRAAGHAMLGVMYESEGNQKKAEAAYKKAIEVEPNWLGPRRNLAAIFDARADAERQKLQQMQNEIVQRRVQNPNDPSIMEKYRDQFIDAQMKFEENSSAANALREEELELLARRARLLPNNGESQYDYGVMLSLFNDSEEAERRLTTAVLLEPQNPQYRFALALFYQKQEQWDEAISAMHKLIEMRPDNVEYHQVLVQMRQQAAAPPAQD